MTRQAIILKLKAIAEKLDFEALDINANYRDQGFDSLDWVEFILAVETEFGLSIDDRISASFEKPSDLVEFIEEAL